MTSAYPSTLGPLSPGKVVSAAIRLYRDRFKTYIGLSAKAAVWWLVPIYGWAKYGMIMGQMSRLAFQELMNQPESARESYRAVSPKLWAFLGTGLLTVVILSAANIAISIASAIIGGILGFVLGFLLSAFGDTGVGIAGSIAYIVQLLVSFAAQLWIAARLLIPEIPIAVEPNSDATIAISRSWKLSEGSVFRIQLALLASYLIIIPIIFLGIFFLGVFIFIVFQAFTTSAGPGVAAILLTILAVFAVIIGINILVLPFTQTMKGVIYYDLRTRREGLDLNLASNSSNEPV